MRKPPEFKGTQGDRINNVEALVDAARKRKCVFCPGPGVYWCQTPTPAAWVQNQIGSVLSRLFRTGLYIYNPPAIIREPTSK